MPRTAKAAGTAVDKRNGRRLALPAVRLEYFPLPPRRPAWLAETREAWEVAWADPVHELWTPADGPLLLRWADARDRAARSARRADRKPVVLGSVGQVVEHPSYGTWKSAVTVAERCEQQLGMGALNRSKLGVEAASAAKSWDMDDDEGLDGDDDDPR